MGNAPGALHHAQQRPSSGGGGDDDEAAFVLASVPKQIYGAYGLPVGATSASASPAPRRASSPPSPSVVPLSLLDEEFEEEYASGRPLHQHQRKEYGRSASPESPMQSPASAASALSALHSPPSLPSASPSASPDSGGDGGAHPTIPPRALDSVSLEVQLQFIRVMCAHLDLQSLIAAGRVNTHWRRALAPDCELVAQPVQSPLSASSGSEWMGSPMSSGGSSGTPSSQLPPSARAPAAAEELEEEPLRSSSAPPAASFAALHMNPFASPLGWAAPPALQPSDAAGAALSPSVADSAGDSSSDSGSEDSSSSDPSDSDDGGAVEPRIRFHAEPAPFPSGLGPHLSRLSTLGRSAWHPALELVVPARGGWLEYASRSGVMRGAQRVELCADAERIVCVTRAPSGGPAADDDPDADPDGLVSASALDFPAGGAFGRGAAAALSAEESAQRSQLSSPTQWSDPLSSLCAFPFLRALRCSLPLEGQLQFRRDGPARLRAAFAHMALTLRELHWELLPERQAGEGDAGQLEQQNAAAAAVPAGADPQNPIPALSGEPDAMTESDRAQLFCLSVLESLPLLSLHSLSLSQWTLPSSCDLSALRSLPLLRSLHLGSVGVTAARVVVVRGLLTLRRLDWHGWDDSHAALFFSAPPPALSELGLAYASVGLLGLRALARSAVAPRLAALRLDECGNIGDQCCGLIASKLRGIKTLALRRDSDDAAGAGSGVGSDPSAHGEKFTAAGLCCLATLPALTRLELVGAGIPLRHCLPQFCAALRATMDADDGDEGHNGGRGGDCASHADDCAAGCAGGRDSSGQALSSSPSSPAPGLRTLVLSQVRLSPSAMELASLAAAAASDNPSATVPAGFAMAFSSASQSAAFKHLTQLRTLTALAVRRCAATDNLLAYVALLPQLRRLELERRRTQTAAAALFQQQLQPASPPAAALLGAAHCTRGGGKEIDHSWAIAGAHPESQSQSQSHPSVRAPAAASRPSSDPFGSILLLSRAPRLERLSCNFAQPVPSGPAAGQPLSGGSLGHCGDGVLVQLRRLQGAFRARGRRVLCEWRGMRVSPPDERGDGEGRRGEAAIGHGEADWGGGDEGQIDSFEFA